MPRHCWRTRSCGLHALRRLSFRIRAADRLLASFSVRTRIIVLALIPVVGFLANGMTYTVGRTRGRQRLSNGASARPRWPTPAAISRARSQQMRIAVKDFTAQPSQNLIQAFEPAHDAAPSQTSIRSTPSVDSDRRDEHRALAQAQLDDAARRNFDKLVAQPARRSASPRSTALRGR